MKLLALARSSEPLRRELALVGPLILGFLALLATVVLWAPSPIDREFTRSVQGLPWNDFKFIPQLGSDVGGGVYGTLLMPALVAGWFAVTRRWKLLLLLGAVFALHYVLISPKLFITAYRPSPDFGVNGGGGLESFPSGHVQWAVSFYGLLAYLTVANTQKSALKGAAVAAYAIIVLLTMLGRIELGRHWLTDTIAGVLVGLLALRLLVALHRWPAVDHAAARARALLPVRLGVRTAPSGVTERPGAR